MLFIILGRLTFNVISTVSSAESICNEKGNKMKT